VFSFPTTINDYAARTVATGVVLLSVAALALRQPWLLVPLAYGFWARVLFGPRFSPLAQFATRVVEPRLPWEPKLVAGPPKRFAQAMGVAFSTTALVLWYGFGEHTATGVVVAMLIGAAFLEAAFGYCLGCKVFALLMRVGVIPESACVDCGDLSRRHPDLARTSR
jgi:hypothetical protein